MAPITVDANEQCNEADGQYYVVLHFEIVTYTADINDGLVLSVVSSHSCSDPGKCFRTLQTVPGAYNIALRESEYGPCMGWGVSTDTGFAERTTSCEYSIDGDSYQSLPAEIHDVEIEAGEVVLLPLISLRAMAADTTQ